MAFNEARLGDHRFKVGKDRIETFDMTHLQHAIFPLGQFHEFGSLRGVIGHRFLDENMLALLQK